MRKYTPLHTQVSGAAWLAERKNALLADEPRVGKTGTAIMAADAINAKRVLVVTTASGRAVWQQAWADWSDRERSVTLLTNKRVQSPGDVLIMSWGAVIQNDTQNWLLRQTFDLMILDESHYARSVQAKRARAVFGQIMREGEMLAVGAALCSRAERIWCLTGTPTPNTPLDLYPMLRCLFPEALQASGELPDVQRLPDYISRYVKTRPFKVNAWSTIQLPIGGKNATELRQRLDGLFLRRTQQDVGIQPPRYETLPVLVTQTELNKIDIEPHLAREILKAAEEGDGRRVEAHLGPVRRMTGVLKAPKVAEAVVEALDSGLKRIVLAYWHRDVGDALVEHIGTRARDRRRIDLDQQIGVARVDGSTTPRDRAMAVEAFNLDGGPRVFLAQIKAAGEAIDLSAADTLWFVESSFTPADMRQMALRVTNSQRKRNCFVKVVMLPGSIDEAVSAVVLRKMEALREVMK
jgi:SWI/SNF-related matrix-associated actin-dependent regulator 1 of chromatin subfamily A